MNVYIFHVLKKSVNHKIITFIVIFNEPDIRSGPDIQTPDIRIYGLFLRTTTVERCPLRPWRIVIDSKRYLSSFMPDSLIIATNTVNQRWQVRLTGAYSGGLDSGWPT